MKKITKKIILAGLLLVLLLPLTGFAQDFGFDNDQTSSWLAKMNLSKLDEGGVAGTIVTIINVLLGLLAVIAVSLIIYAGFSYMLSGGDPAKIKTARGVIATSVIGLVIIISGYAIANFAFTALNEATGGDETNTNMNTGPGLSPECAAVGGRACVPLGGDLGGFNIHDCEDAREHVYNLDGKYDGETWVDLGENGDCVEAYGGNFPNNLAETCFCDQGRCCGVSE